MKVQTYLLFLETKVEKTSLELWEMMLSYVQHETNYFEVIGQHYLRKKGHTIEIWMSDMRNPSVKAD